MQLPPNPKLRDVTKICKSSKDVDFLKLFDSNKSSLYPSVRHRYNQLVDIVANGISHLKLFTKHLKNIIDAQQLSSDSCLAIVEQYREEEPTLNTAGFVKLADEASVSLPPHLSEQKTDVSELHRKTDIDAYSDIFGFERNMAKLLVMYWKRLNTEIYSPLYEYRKACITKLESVQENVSIKYDKLIKAASKLRELKVSTIDGWNDLCDARHSLRKARINAPDSNKTKKQSSKCKSLESKASKQFDTIIEFVDKFNNQQDEFWNEVIMNACLQLEAIEYSRICFYQEYFDKYHELLKWRRAELENGENTLARARKMMMTPFEIAEYGVHPIRIDYGNYTAIQPQQYELPCMPQEIFSLTGKITEQRINPQILNPVYNPFGEELKPSSSRHIRTNYSRSASVIYHPMHQIKNSMNNNHDREPSESISRSVSMSMSMSMSMSSTIHPPPGINGGGTGFNAKQLISSQPTHSFYRDNTKTKLFERTNRQQTHNGGLPRPLESDSEDDLSSDNSQNNNNLLYRSPSLGPISPPPQKLPPRKSPIGYTASNAPQLPPRKKSHNKPPKRPPNTINNNNNNKPPQLPPRKKTLPNTGNKRKNTNKKPPNKKPPNTKPPNTKPPNKKPPNKSAMEVAKVVRKNSAKINENNSKTNNNKIIPSTDIDNNNGKKKKSKWKIGK